MLERARDLLATGPLCDPCLGRPFADRSFGLTNRERGDALRVAVAMADDEDYEPPAEEDCWVCEGVCAEHDAWAERVVDTLEGFEFSTYQVGTRVPPLVEENDRLLREEAGLGPETGEQFKKAFNREVGKRVGARTGAEVDLQRPDVLAVCHVERDHVERQVNAAFVYGRYRKLQRDIPQTEWPCGECGGTGDRLGDDGAVDCEHCGGTGYMYPTSVEEEIAPHVREAMDGADATFHGAGREDVDARTLGTGRPFVVEVTEPRVRRPDIAALAERIDEVATSVAADGLRLATYDVVERVKELPASKTYRLSVHLAEPVTADDVAFTYSAQDEPTLHDVSFDVTPGEYVGIVGPTGAGKTTLFNLITGTLPTDSGTIMLYGKAIGHLSAADRTRAGLGRTFQSPRIFRGMTVLDNLRFAATGQTGESITGALFRPGATTQEEADVTARAQSIAEFLEIDHLLDEYARGLSGGQRKLLEIGRVLMLEPTVMLLDEPTAGVNPALTDQIVDRLHEINDEGTTIVLIEHDMELVMTHCDQVVVLNDGATLATGDPETVQSNDQVMEVYLGGD